MATLPWPRRAWIGGLLLSGGLLAAGVAGLGALLDEGLPAWPGAGAAPAWWPQAPALGPWHAALGAGLALALLAGVAWACVRLRGGPRGLAGLALLDTLLLAGSGAALAPGGWRDGGLPAGLDPWIATQLIEAAAEAHVASAALLPLLIGAAWAGVAWRAAFPRPD